MLGNGKAMLLAVPTVSSITRLDTNPADAGEVEFAVTFSDPVTGVDVTDFALSTTGVVGAYVDHIHTTADPAVVVVHARTGVGAGTVRLDLVDDDTIITGQGTKLGGLGTANGSFSTGEVYTVVQPPPVVQSAVVGDGTAQRSMVRELRVTFDYPVVTAGIPADAFMLVGPGGSVAVSVDTASLSTPFQTIAKLTFAGPGGSLTDGDYTLTVLGIKISTGGVALDGDGNGSPGGDYVLTFHRLFGDADGDRDVDAGDFGAFRTAFGTSSAVFDSDADGDVDAADFGAFRSAFGTSLPSGRQSTV